MLRGWEHAAEGRGCLELPCTDIVLSYAALDARGIKVLFSTRGFWGSVLRSGGHQGPCEESNAEWARGRAMDFI